MSRRFILSWSIPFALLSLSALPLFTDAQEHESATIVNSGSTNRPGFRIAIDSLGAAEYTAVSRRAAPQAPGPRRLDAAQPAQKILSRALADRFFADLKAAQPFSALPPVHCIKSASFGSSLTISYNNEQTPDLSCGDGGNESLRNLIRDAQDIVAAFQSN